MVQLHFLPIAQCLLLLALANGVPVIAKKVLGDRLAWPIDGGWHFWDGQPLLGKSKTLRGLVLAVLATAIGGPLVGLNAPAGALVGFAAIVGDMLSSFLKRRLRLASSAEAPGLDQVPESLLPLVLVRDLVGLSVWDILVGVGAFWIGELLVSRFLYMLHIRDRPY
ncbi:CDP-archaeol synthase [Mesorhizobium sp. WSM4884]|uniref:CDP-archaeol synthase n=1 Tax=Mesorhizobium sp. WSM4884 TaxID=3038542 RepID=UPI0024165A81|nr:CDP-archaeol synthase [Mesorhizobium sp. WSM4884]MDG4884484.1 CDP-archaeol synthase [Mesorhizobium sp. WSM4884]